MSQLFYFPSINQIQLTFKLSDELKRTETAPCSLESISVVKIIIGIADNALASGLVQSFQAAFGRVQVSDDGLNESWFRALWEYAKAQVALSPNDKQARLEFAYAYALLHGSGQAHRADKEAWDRRERGGE
ncbi:hypothetical protein DV738_g4483, partial [Chaetothyriales sp. CBS 135597]